MLEFLTTQPGVVESPATTIFRENQAIGSALGTFTWKHGSAQPNAKTVCFDLNLTFHQYNLEGPALEPAESEGIGHGFPFSATRIPYGPGVLVQGRVSANAFKWTAERVFWHSKPVS